MWKSWTVFLKQLLLVELNLQHSQYKQILAQQTMRLVFYVWKILFANFKKA